MTIRAYLRVSTDAQDEASQTAIISEWSKRTGRTVGFFHSDTASGSVPWEKRQIAAVLAGSSPGDTIVVSEISRIARSILGVLSFLQAAAIAEVEIVAIRSGIALDNSLSSKIVVTILALAAEVERDLIRERTKAALSARRQAGLPLGRPHGARSASILGPKADDIAAMLKAKVSKRAICRVLGCSPGTLYAYLRGETNATHDTTTKDIFEEQH
jgi:DNA invertase Pin-like site-specific DNA recombinase